MIEFFWGVFGLGPLWWEDHEELCCRIFLAQNRQNYQVNTIICKHAHCAVLCTGLIQTSQT